MLAPVNYCRRARSRNPQINFNKEIKAKTTDSYSSSQSRSRHPLRMGEVPRPPSRLEVLERIATLPLGLCLEERHSNRVVKLLMASSEKVELTWATRSTFILYPHPMLWTNVHKQWPSKISIIWCMNPVLLWVVYLVRFRKAPSDLAWHHKRTIKQVVVPIILLTTKTMDQRRLIIIRYLAHSELQQLPVEAVSLIYYNSS